MTGPHAMRRDLFVYLSGPMTAAPGVTTAENVHAALAVFRALFAKGIPAFCPHLTFPLLWEDFTYAQWMAYDLAVLERCTHLLLLPRWETSAGARQEKAHAEACGIPVVTDMAMLDLVEIDT